MKNLLTIVFFLFSAFTLYAQEAQESNLELRKNEFVNGMSIVLEGKTANVQTVMTEIFRKETNAKPKEVKGVATLANVVLRPVSMLPQTYSYKITKANKEGTVSKIDFFVAQGTTFLTAKTHAKEMQGAKKFLESLPREIKIYELNLAIKEQEEVVKKEEKAQTELEKNLTDLENKRDEILRNIETNKQNQEKQKAVIALERDRLQGIKTELQKMQ